MEISLGAPGAGLPPLELALAKGLFWLFRKGHSPKKALHKLRRETNLTKGLVNGLSQSQLRTRQLIKRVLGIEDSSRNWSVGMTLEHMIIVNTGILAVIKALVMEQPAILPPVSIAAVKPPIDTPPDIVEQFTKNYQEYVEAVAKIDNFKTKTNHAHPWFGPLDAHGWHCLVAVHQAIHRRQIAMIIAQAKINQRG